MVLLKLEWEKHVPQVLTAKVLGPHHAVFHSCAFAMLEFLPFPVMQYA